MKKALIAILALIIATVSFVGCNKEEEVSGDNSLQEIKDKGYLVLGLDDSFPPMGFRGEDNEIVGFDINMAKEVATRLGVELQLQPIDWDAKVMELDNGNIDVIWNGLTITDERKEQIGFSTPYLNNRQIMIVGAESKIDKKADLDGKLVGVQMGSSGEEALSASEEADSIKEIVKYSNYTEALLDLKAGRVDAVVVDEVVGRYYIAKKPGEYKVASENFGSEEYGIGFRKTDQVFLQEVDKILEEMKAEGVTTEIAEKWFGDDAALK